MPLLPKMASVEAMLTAVDTSEPEFTQLMRSDDLAASRKVYTIAVMIHFLITELVLEVYSTCIVLCAAACAFGSLLVETS